MVLALEAQGMARPMVQHLSETKLAAMLAQVTSVATTPDRGLTTGSTIGIADLTTGSAIGIVSNHFDIRASTFVITASTTRFPLGAQGVQAVPPGRLSTPIRHFFLWQTWLPRPSNCPSHARQSSSRHGLPEPTLARDSASLQRWLCGTHVCTHTYTHAYTHT